MQTLCMATGVVYHDDALKSRSVKIDRRRTTIRMDDETWEALQDIARRELSTINEICEFIEVNRPDDLSLTVAIRIFALRYFREAATEKGHTKAGHKHTRHMRKIAEQLKQGGF
jgi:predicted DNA-binding ribbon-helix-helix protein